MRERIKWIEKVREEIEKETEKKTERKADRVTMMRRQTANKLGATNSQHELVSYFTAVLLSDSGRFYHGVQISKARELIAARGENSSKSYHSTGRVASASFAGMTLPNARYGEIQQKLDVPHPR